MTDFEFQIDNFMLFCTSQGISYKTSCENELEAHEQLTFFNRVDYRDYLMEQFSI
jgi:hypothetical protein